MSLNVHSDPVAPILLALVLIAIGGMIGGNLMRRIGQPAVLGELLVGAFTANIAYAFGWSVFSILREGTSVRQIMTQALTKDESLAVAARSMLPASAHTEKLIAILSSPSGPVAIEVFHFIDILSRIAVIVLLFLVGLETSVGEMRKVGKASLYVACLGVAAPFVLGLTAMMLLDPESSLEKSLFVGVILTATSVGITARIFRDLRQERRPEARTILGAAVFDDVLGLLLLTIFSGFVATGSVDLRTISAVTLKAVLFLGGSIFLGVVCTPGIIRIIAHLRIANFKLLFGVGAAFFLAWLANLVGLAPIVGAFAAGLALEEFFFDELREEHSLRHLLSPVESLIVPVFFVLIGIQVKFETFRDPKVIFMALVLTVVAVAGKLASGLGAGNQLNRLAIGIGMMPRGEVAFIFAGVGKGLGVISDGIFSAVVIMVMTTTFLTPPLLKMALSKSGPPDS
jgi:Kef-type K+ transport system membrane component KefB